MITTIALSFLTVIVIFLLKIIVPPWNFPNNIPTIPFYVTFLTTFFDLDQEDIFRLYLAEPLEKYGAVKIYFGSRWNILVSRPTYLSQMFKDEDTFAKSGNQKKIPYSVMAEYTGDNVISAHGKIWKLYRNSVTNGLQFFDHKPMVENARLFCSLLKEQLNKECGQSLNYNKLSDKSKKEPCSNKAISLPECDDTNISILSQSASLEMADYIQRLTLANISQVALGFDFGTLTEDKAPLHQQLKYVKKQVFKPLFLNFPFLDKLPLPSRQSAREEVSKFRKNLVDQVRENLMNNYLYEQTSFASSELIRNYNREKLNEKQLTDNIVIIMVAGHENPQLLLTTLLYMLAKHHNTWQVRLRKELRSCSMTEIHELPLFNAFFFECIRMYPPLGQIINRCTSKTCVLGRDIVIPKGSYVGYNVYATGRSRTVWGNDSNEFRPERWGLSYNEVMDTWRHSKNSCAMSAFHGGRRACLGEKLALTELRITVAEMLTQFQWRLAPDWKDKMTPAGPLCPLNLKLKIEPLNQ